MTCGLVSVQSGWLLNTGKTNKVKQTYSCRTATGWPPNTDNKYSVCMYEQKIGTLKTGRLIEAGGLIQGHYIQFPLYLNY